MTIIDNFLPERLLPLDTDGCILTNINIFSPDSHWIVYDTRSDRDGSDFDGLYIRIVDMESGAMRTLYSARNGAHVGVATFHPIQSDIVFIHGPENPSADWEYGPAHRQGAQVSLDQPEIACSLDARDLVSPFTPGALRGGSHVHVFHPLGQMVSFTYDDALLPGSGRNVAVAFRRHVAVPGTHSRNHNGEWFSVLVSRTTPNPRPGSDEYRRAFEEGWLGPRNALAFLGETVNKDGAAQIDTFVAILPRDPTVANAGGPLCGTATAMPSPPDGVVVRRLTRTGVCATPRHWLRASSDGRQLALLLPDTNGVAQLHILELDDALIPLRAPQPITDNPAGATSAFSWTPDGREIAIVLGTSVCLIDVETAVARRRTPPCAPEDAPLPHACVVSPDGRTIAYQRRIADRDGVWRNRIALVPTR